MKPILFNTEMVKAILDGRKTVTRRVVKPQHSRYADGSKEDFENIERDARFPFLGVAKNHPNIKTVLVPPCVPSDILYVRETWATTEDGHDYLYRADANPAAGGFIRDKAGKLHAPRWHPSIHMPKEAARIFLRVTNVHVERLIDSFRKTGDVVSDFATEGVDLPDECETCLEVYGNPCCNDLNEALPYDDATGEDTNGGSECGMLEEVIQSFADLWDSTIKPDNLSCSGFSANPWVWVIEFERCEKPKEET